MSAFARSTLRPRLLLLAVLVAALPPGCSNDEGPITVDDRARLAGLYAAAAGDGGSFGALVWTADSVDPDGRPVSRDLIEDGATIELVLSADGTTSGRLHIPAGVPGVPDFDADLAGTWTLDGDAIDLEHTTDTFLRDVPFLAIDDRLEGELTDGGVTVRVVLARREG